MKYEEKRLYEVLKTINKSHFLTQYQLVKYENDMFGFLVSQDYIQPIDAYAPTVKYNGRIEAHDTDRYELSSKGFCELKRLGYIRQGYLKELCCKYISLAISLVSLGISILSYLRTSDIQPEVKQYVKTEIAKAINDTQSGKVLDNGSVNNALKQPKTISSTNTAS